MTIDTPKTVEDFVALWYWTDEDPAIQEMFD